jgi:hypothetical protein
VVETLFPTPREPAGEILTETKGRSDCSDLWIAGRTQHHAGWMRVIKPGIEKAGYRPFRLDQTEHDRRIDDEIIAGIRRCRFLVADFTKQRNGVYFEAGMALGLGRHGIWMCRHAEKDLLHSDTRQFNHILYDDFEEARKALTNRIVALEGQRNYVSESD